MPPVIKPPLSCDSVMSLAQLLDISGSLFGILKSEKFLGIIQKSVLIFQFVVVALRDALKAIQSSPPRSSNHCGRIAVPSMEKGPEKRTHGFSSLSFISIQKPINHLVI